MGESDTPSPAIAAQRLRHLDPGVAESSDYGDAVQPDRRLLECDVLLNDLGYPDPFADEFSMRVDRPMLLRRALDAYADGQLSVRPIAQLLGTSEEAMLEVLGQRDVKAPIGWGNPVS